MSPAIVRKEIESWSSEEQDNLAAFLTVLRLKRNKDHANEMSRRLDDRTPGSWLTLDEVKKKLATD